MTDQQMISMSLEDLRKFIEQVIEEKIQVAPIHRPLDDVLNSMRQNMIQPAKDQPSIVEMLREDRDR